MWHWMRKDKQPLNQGDQGGSLFAWKTLGTPLWTPRRYDKLAQEGYQRNVIVYRCVTLIARGAGSVGLRLVRHGQTVSEHPLLTLMKHPSPTQSGASFVESVVSHLLLSGNAFVEMIPNGEGMPMEFYPLRPDRVQALMGAEGSVVGYEYRTGKSVKRFPVDPVTGRSNLLHLKLFHPLNDWYGMSPIEAAAAAIDQHNAVGGHNLSLLQNGGRPSGVFMVRPQGSTGGFLTPDQRDTLRQDLKATYEGTQNAGRMMVLEGDFEWKEMGLSPKDMDFVEGKIVSAREIAQAFGVPAMLVGVPGESTFSNYREARLQVWEDTILPILDNLISEFNTWVLPLYGPGLELVSALETVPALALKREMAWNRVSGASFLTLNEKRQALGFEPLANGDQMEVSHDH